MLSGARRESPRPPRRRRPRGAGRGAPRPRRSRARSRGRRRSGCAPGRSARASPSCALCARGGTPTLSQHGVGDDDDERRVGAVPPRTACRPGTPGAPGGAVEPATTRPSSPITSPTAFTTASATTLRVVARAPPRRRSRPRPRARGRATSRPSRRGPRRPGRSASVAAGRGDRGRVALVGAGRGAARLDEVEHARGRARSAPGRPRSGSPGPRSARNRITPSAAASPNAEPPASTTASTRATVRPGSSSATSRRRGRAAADLAGADRALGREQHGDAGAVAGPVPDAQARDRDREPLGIALSARCQRRARVAARRVARRRPRARSRRSAGRARRRVRASACGRRRGTPRGARPGSAARSAAPAPGGVSTSAVPTITSVGMRTFGSSAVRSRPISARGASSRVSGGQSRSICRTSSTWLGCGSRPKPMRASSKPEVRRRPHPAHVGRAVRDLLDARLRARRVRSERRLGERREQHDAGDALGRDLGEARHERLHRDAAHRVADEHRAAEVEALHARCARRRARFSSECPAVPTTDWPWPRWSNAIVRKPARGSASSWWNHVADRVGDAVREHDRRTLARLDDVDRAAVERVEPAVDVHRRVERARRVAVGPAPQPAREQRAGRRSPRRPARRRRRPRRPATFAMRARRGSWHVRRAGTRGPMPHTIV